MSSPVILITGASQGIGAAIAKTFAHEVRGCRLALVARNEKNLRAVARACEKLGASAAVFPCNVADAAAVAAMAGAVRKEFGIVDVLINNAGHFFGAPFLQTPVEKFDEMFAANLRSAFLVSRAFAPAMVRRGRGDIFLMGSVASFKALPGMAAYGAAKHGVLGLARVMREELKTKGVRVTAVLPGATWSPSWAGRGVPAGRLMPAEDVARAFLDIYRLSRRTVVEEIVLRPQLGDL
ncbi:MAG TPA: SDR family oxidoreductase [Opitutaceae bacterium]|jgi:NAD(P)-dependent dehydrogenase (short-subunit alcohol dehydrogenase family)|nr:SDR family oxidoreductase [Opitutaceae bacterium]